MIISLSFYLLFKVVAFKARNLMFITKQVDTKIVVYWFYKTIEDRSNGLHIFINNGRFNFG